MSDPHSDAHAELSAIDRVRLDPRLRTRDDSGIAAITIGTLAWAVAWIVLTLVDGSGFWRGVSAAGFGFGVIGWVLLVARARRVRRRTRQE